MCTIALFAVYSSAVIRTALTIKFDMAAARAKYTYRRCYAL